MELISRVRCYNGFQEVHQHNSESCAAPMKFAIYLPDLATTKEVPVLYWLSGLTCTEQNFIQKSGAQRFASQYGFAVVAPDTSPRGLNIPGDSERYDFGQGAGFYVDATEAPWNKHYRMYSYITKELPEAIAAYFPIDASRQGIFGHSMGGHGALTIGLRHPEKFQSLSAFSPICAPTKCPWGEYAFERYLGHDRHTWEEYDAHLLVNRLGYNRPILIDQGEDDEFLKTQLHPELFARACEERGVDLKLRIHPRYDHSYYFIATFIEDHFKFHYKNLVQKK